MFKASGEQLSQPCPQCQSSIFPHLALICAFKMQAARPLPQFVCVFKMAAKAPQGIISR